MNPMNVVMLGRDYLNPTLPAGVFGGDMFGADHIPFDISSSDFWNKLYPGRGDVAANNAYTYRYSDGLTDEQIYAQIKIDMGGAGTTTSVGKTVQEIWNGISANVKASDLATIILAIKGQNPGLSDAEARAIANSRGGFDLQANMPWIILGGAALLAIIFMAGTRRRR